MPAISITAVFVFALISLTPFMVVWPTLTVSGLVVPSITKTASIGGQANYVYVSRISQSHKLGW